MRTNDDQFCPSFPCTHRTAHPNWLKKLGARVPAPAQLAVKDFTNPPKSPSPLCDLTTSTQAMKLSHTLLKS